MANWPRLIGGIVIGLALAGCASDAARAPMAAPPPPVAQAEAPRPLPAAERLGDDLVMVPVARDGRGCVQYQMIAEREQPLSAVFYRTYAGDFSTIEEEAACT